MPALGGKQTLARSRFRLILGHMKRLAILAPFLVAANGCSSPITSSQDLNGCYFAAGPDWIFKITDGDLADRRDRILATISLTKSSLGDSVVVLTPGIRLTETPQKSMVVVQGDIRKLLAAKGRTGVRLVALEAIGGIEFQRRQCA